MKFSFFKTEKKSLYIAWASFRNVCFNSEFKSDMLHEELFELSKKHGPVMSIYLGTLVNRGSYTSGHFMLCIKRAFGEFNKFDMK